MTERKSRHIANPIEHHGHIPAAKFAPIVNDLIRDGSITSDAFRVLALLLSHDAGWQESVNEIAKRFGWGRVRTRNAMDALTTARLLVVQRYVTANGTRAYERYHVHRSRRFTDAEVAKFGATVVLPKRTNPLVQNEPTPWSEMDQPPGPIRTNTEYKEENKEEVRPSPSKVFGEEFLPGVDEIVGDGGHGPVAYTPPTDDEWTRKVDGWTRQALATSPGE